MLKLYVQDNCTQCKFTEKKLDSLGIKYKTINLDHDQADPDYIERLKLREMGFLATPIGIPENEDLAFAGFQPSTITELHEKGEI